MCGAQAHHPVELTGFASKTRSASWFCALKNSEENYLEVFLCASKRKKPAL